MAHETQTGAPVFLIHSRQKLVHLSPSRPGKVLPCPSAYCVISDYEVTFIDIIPCQTGDGFRCQVVVFGFLFLFLFFPINSEDEDRGVYEEESEMMTPVFQKDDSDGHLASDRRSE